MKKILFETKYVIITLHADEKILYVEWKGFALNEQYRDVLAKQIEYTKKHNASKIIYDLRKMGVISSENQKYTDEVYFPEVAKAGSKFAGIILPESLFGKASAENILGKENNKLFKAQLFDQPERAIDWLKAAS